MRVDPGTFFEAKFWDSGWLHVAGLDEAGRGALAGPGTRWYNGRVTGE